VQGTPGFQGNTMYKASPLFLAAFALLLPAPVHAASYTVNPTRVYLKASAQSALMTLTNESDAPLRMQIRAQQWTQTRAGTMELSATADLIVFPTLVTLNPGEQRRIRVATSVPFGAVEKSYRLYVEELPAAARDASAGPAVRILTRMGIPVFLQPSRPVATATLQAVGLSGGKVAFELANTGNTHYIPDGITVRGFTAAGQPVSDWPVHGWYVLAGGTRAFEVELEAPACADVRSLLIEVRIGQTVLKSPLTTPGGACAASAP
jgi:fimbrial chaperone protein